MDSGGGGSSLLPLLGVFTMGRIIAVLACSSILAGCSSSMLPSIDFFKSSPSTESLRVESEPPGAEAKTAAGQSCRTPCELKIQPGTDQSITLALNGYEPHTVALRQEGNDSGKLAPNPLFVELKTVPPVASKKKKTAAKKKPTTTAAVATPTTTASAAPSAPTQPAAAPEPAPAMNSSYPWSNPR
jgi:hypothetical protein